MSTKKKAKKSNRGGARPGSGRPRVGDGKSYQVNTTVGVELMQALKRVAKEESVTISGAVRILINAGLINR